MPDFSEIVCAEEVFHIISAIGQIPVFHRTYFFIFLMYFRLQRGAAFISSLIHLLYKPYPSDFFGERITDYNPRNLLPTFLTCNAMHSADYAVTRCFSVCLSHVCILLKRLNTSSNFFHCHSHTTLAFAVLNGMAILRREPS